jgi:hypothetical protein
MLRRVVEGVRERGDTCTKISDLERVFIYATASWLTVQKESVALIMPSVADPQK